MRQSGDTADLLQSAILRVAIRLRPIGLRIMVGWRPMRLSIALSIPLATICLSCGSLTSPVEVVRNGVLEGYPSTTVGRAFEATFQNAKWTTIDTAKGQTIVQFDGTVETRKFGKLTTGEELLYAESSMKSKCMAALGVTEQMTELIRQREEMRTANHVNDPGWNYDWTWIQLNQQILATNTKLAQCMNNSPTPVRFQFTLSVRSQGSFDLTYVDPVFDSPQRALSFIYGP